MLILGKVRLSKGLKSLKWIVTSRTNALQELEIQFYKISNKGGVSMVK